MERFAWFYYELLEQAANVKAVIMSLMRKVPFLGGLADTSLEWIFIALVFFVAVVVILPLIKWSVKISVAAVVIAGVVAFFTSFSFWGLLPFSGLGVAIVLFSNKFQME